MWFLWFIWFFSTFQNYKKTSTIMKKQEKIIVSSVRLIDEVGLGKRVIFNPPHSFYLKMK